MPMKVRFIILLVFACINLFGGTKDTTHLKFVIKERSRILDAIDKHLKYDEIYAIQCYMSDTLHIVVNRVLYNCNPAYAVEIIENTRRVIKNNDYKYKLKITDEEESSTYDYIYYGYNKQKTKDGYTIYDKYQVTIEFVEYKGKIIFVAIILSPVDED